MTLRALPLVLVLALPGGREYARDLEVALERIGKECRTLLRVKGIDWRKVEAEFRREVREVRTDQEHYALLVRLLARLRDGHAGVRTTEATRGVAWPGPRLERGPGMFWCVSGGKVLVKNAFDGAAAAGVTPGMEVVEVDDRPALKWLEEREAALSEWISFSTPQHARYFACHWGLAGEEGSRMEATLRAPDGKRKKAILARTSRSIVAAGPAVFPEGLRRVGRQSCGRTPKGFGYIHLRDTPGNLPEQLDAMLAALGEVPGLVLDGRANGGGGCDHDAVLGRFVPAGKTLSFGKTYRSAGPNPYAGPVVVIVDAGVRSAGETVTGMFKEDGRAYMIGESPTAGMSSSKVTIELPSGLFALFVSVASNKGRFNGGKGIEGIGVPPHEVVPYDPADLAAGVDTLLARAETLLEDFPEKEVPFKAERRR